MPRRAFIVVDLGFGDAGKGATVDYLVAKHGIKTVVRFNGGPQAQHNVVLPDGRHHAFSQWGSGTFEGAKTVLGPHVLVNPLNAFLEAAHLESVGVHYPWNFLFVDHRCPIITPWHVAVNKVNELSRGDSPHGSCAQGVGATMADVVAGKHLVAEDLRHQGKGGLRTLLARTRDRKAEELREKFGSNVEKTSPFRDAFPGSPKMLADWFETFSKQAAIGFDWGLFDEDIVYEGAQGILLDQEHGFFPNVTWSDCTFHNAEILALAMEQEITRIGVTRTYMTRHGAGLFPTENDTLSLPEPHNSSDGAQGAFRVGTADFNLLKYAIDMVDGVDMLALNHIDFGVPGLDATDPVRLFSQVLHTHVGIEGRGPTREDRIDHF